MSELERVLRAPVLQLMLRFCRFHAAVLLLAGCLASQYTYAQMAATFAGDVAFLKNHTAVQVLAETAGRAKVIVSPAMQEFPYTGDLINSYNDGAPEPGALLLGPFYELESSSPAAALKPQEQLSHIHRTVHLQGADMGLDRAARKVLGFGLKEIASVFEL